MKDLDASYPRENAERRLRVKPGRLSLDELAQRLSVEHNPDEPLSVRDISAKPITHIRVYRNGETLSQQPYLSEYA